MHKKQCQYVMISISSLCNDIIIHFSHIFVTISLYILSIIPYCICNDIIIYYNHQQNTETEENNMKAYYEITLKSGVINISKKGIRFRTWEQLNEIKQAWRKSRNWHPVESLFEII